MAFQTDPHKKHFLLLLYNRFKIWVYKITTGHKNVAGISKKFEIAFQTGAHTKHTVARIMFFLPVSTFASKHSSPAPDT